MMRLAGAALILIAAISLIGGLALGGILETGQVEPLGWLGPQMLAMVLLGLAAGGRAWRVAWPVLPLGVIGTLTAIAVLCGIAGDRVPMPALLWLAAGSLCALALGWALPRVRRSWRARGSALLAGAAAIGVLAFPPASALLPDADGPPVEVALVTSLPIVWDAAPAPGDGPRALSIETALAPNIRLVPLAAAGEDALAGHRYLLLAHPRLLAPAELVAIDRWVRDGGRAVILADPWLVWPMDLPPGDRRRPPVTSLLDPLMRHWGLELEATDAGQDGVERRRLSSGAMLPVAGASRFAVKGGGCRLAEDGLMALCAIGSGQARLVADADLIDDRLWSADPKAATRREMTGDTIALLHRWIMEPLAPERGLEKPINWVRNDTALLSGVRWALLAGMGWVIMGLATLRLCGWRRGLGETGTSIEKKGKFRNEMRTKRPPP